MQKSDQLEGLSLPEIQQKLESMRRLTSVVTSRPRVRKPAVAAHQQESLDVEGGAAPVVELEEVDSANETRAAHFNRRAFIQGGTAIMATAAVAGPLQSLMARRARGESVAVASPYGDPVPTADKETGLELLKLPPGFKYRSFGWTGDPMIGGTATPPQHDGMAVIAQYGPYALLSRNHEVNVGPSYLGGSIQYSPGAAGGCTNLLFNTWTGRWVEAFPTLSGTVRNCAGGPTPWGSWLTCEETTTSTQSSSFKHGYVFEVGPFGSNAQPLPAMGRFSHEAVSIDPRTGYVYETEDGPSVSGDAASGFYRFIPNFSPFLQFGGKLQMAKLKGVDNFDFQRVVADGAVYELEWVDIENPDPNLEGGETSVYKQGYNQGGALFRRLEGIWYGDGKFYIVSTDGGPNTPDTGSGEGIIFEYTPANGGISMGEGAFGKKKKEKGGTLRVIYTSPAAATLENPDNITISPGGALLMCEDNSGGSPNSAERLVGLTLSGETFTFAENNIDFSSAGLGAYFRQESGRTFTGNQKQNEWAGATFSYDGEWLFVNIQTPGVTFAITGPWRRGPLGLSRRGGEGQWGSFGNGS